MAETGAEARRPLFYERPVPLRAERHGGHKLLDGADYRFAARAHAIPLNAVEFAAAAHSYPIVFTSDPEPLPVAITGIQAGRNPFVAEAGAWAAGEYVPAYVRRYPFLFFEHGGGGQFTLGIDEAAAMLDSEGEGRPLFEGEAPAPASRQALEFCTAFQRELLATRRFAAALEAAGLLAGRALNVRRGDGSRQVLRDFKTVDEERLKALDAETVADWHRRGYLAPIYAHLISMGCWGKLASRE